MSDTHLPTLYVVSDGRGDTCHQLLQAALVQYPEQSYDIVRWPNVRTPEQVHDIVKAAAAGEATIFYTLVSRGTRESIKRFAEDLLVSAVDVLGPAFSALHDVFKQAPQAKPGLFYASDRERFDRHKAIDYTLQHDDGRRLHELGQADVVLVGVSRASKSTTCFYLAYQGIKAANIPLLVDTALPRELLDLDPAMVVGLRMNVMRLMTIREARARNIGLQADSTYLEKRTVAGEVMYANQLMASHGWASLDASYMAVEEIARAVIRLRGLVR